jgi:Flp pilus assembly CpaF family ATPase
MTFAAPIHPPVALLDDDQPLLGRAADPGSLPSEPAVRQAAADTLRRAIHERRLLQLLDPFAPVAERRPLVYEILRAAIGQDRQRGGPLARVRDDAATLDALYNATLGWGPAQRYLDDPQVNEVKIVGRSIRVQEAGQPFVTAPEQFATDAEVLSRAQVLAALLGVPLDGSAPQATLPLAHGTRMHVSIPPRVADGGALVCIRRGRTTAWSVVDLLARGSLDAPTAALLELLCRARCSMLIIGRTGSGKTTLLEALANSWPGDPHIITIEDHTLEIGIRAGVTWTRELVDTHGNEREFGLVAREALRQTPDLVLPGETRAQEAGAILSLILSDHPVMTTIHARDGADGLERFASCAALPHSYMYEGRRTDALRDACSGFDVTIKVDIWAETGQRVITEIALAAGVEATPAGIVAQTAPLVTLEVAPEGHLRWVAHADVVDDQLRWRGADRTPAKLVSKLGRARAAGRLQAGPTSQAVVQQAVREATRLLAAGRAGRALELVRAAWQTRRDGELLRLAQQALPTLASVRQAEEPGAQQQWTALLAAQQAHQWEVAADAFARLHADLVWAALMAPPTGWEAVAAAIAAGQRSVAEAERIVAQARAFLNGGKARMAQQQLDRLTLLSDMTLWDLPTQILVGEIRLAVLTALHGQGQASAEAVASVAAQLAGYRDTVDEEVRS